MLTRSIDLIGAWPDLTETEELMLLPPNSVINWFVVRQNFKVWRTKVPSDAKSQVTVEYDEKWPSGTWYSRYFTRMIQRPSRTSNHQDVIDKPSTKKLFQSSYLMKTNSSTDRSFCNRGPSDSGLLVSISLQIMVATSPWWLFCKRCTADCSALALAILLRISLQQACC